MLSVLVEGALTADPESRTGSRGKPYTIARMRAHGEDGEAVFVSLIAFRPPAAKALAEMANGDAVAIAGHAALNRWEGQGGEQCVGLKVTVSRVMSVFEAGQRRQIATAQHAEPSSTVLSPEEQ